MVSGNSGFIDLQGFWIFRVYRYARFLDIHGFWKFWVYRYTGFLDIQGL